MERTKIESLQFHTLNTFPQEGTGCMTVDACQEVNINTKKTMSNTSRKGPKQKTNKAHGVLLWNPKRHRWLLGSQVVLNGHTRSSGDLTNL